MTTKAQELETLGKIRDLLGTLDADGWVNMAFKGVCDIAENNIRDDFADSPVERVEELERELKETEAKLRTWKGDAEHFKGEYEALKESYNKLQDKAVKRGNLIEEFRQIFTNDFEAANDLILENCENPDSIEFKKAVSARQDAKYRLDRIEEVVT